MPQAKRKHVPAPRRKIKSRKPAPQTTALAVVKAAPERPWVLNEQQVALLKNYLHMGDATELEVQAGLEVARRYRLDPFKQGQIWFIKRWDSSASDGKGGKGAYVRVPQVGIYGMLHIASRDYRDFGSLSEPEYGPMIDVIIEGHKFKAPEWCRVKATKKSMSEPTVATIYFEEFCPKIWKNAESFWARMPRNQIAKCAKAQAIRFAYPDLGGLYIPEEMERLKDEYTESGRQISMPDGSAPGLPPAEFHHGTKEEAQEVGRRRASEAQQRMEKPLPASKKGIVSVSIPSDASDVAYVSGDLSPEFIGYIKLSCSAFKLEDKDVYVIPIEMVKMVEQGCTKSGYAYQEFSGLPSPPATSKESAAAAGKPEPAVPPGPEAPRAPEPGHSGATAVAGFIKMVKGGVKSRNKGIEHYQVVVGEPDSGKGQMLYCYNKNLWPILDQSKGQTAELLVSDNTITGFKRLGKRMFDADGITPEIQVGEERPKPGTLFK